MGDTLSGLQYGRYTVRHIVREIHCLAYSTGDTLTVYLPYSMPDSVSPVLYAWQCISRTLCLTVYLPYCMPDSGSPVLYAWQCICRALCRTVYLLYFMSDSVSPGLYA
ncbi:hypothetical protein KP79_PYT22185 [Mizuhopecten yessoensis]|uniref:Uncharacterized protein n=1 Tax=Mizuhopecten yessoensis TaxID=6573 RepID=A0A210PSX6_MIZYE|nr:hypothetical protein KP79_PYT22185 [Mizuhopecten yessoensis]